ncbi:MAG: pyruvate dehydrogenase (acetyl-transferring) E1 component subunit alpha [Euryarchaeota archaeon RBG_16_68_13]|nr:MAG: pyruvate dehydrogenase (acetyl-transferring) E1 component subunit alpha [Euryarchaeota archaeon RBG_16_68_13]
MGNVLRVIGEDGSTDPKLDPRLPEAEAVRLYRFMLMERILDERMLSLQRQGRIGFYGPSVGQEAAIVAPALALEKDDWIFPQYREPGAALVRGMPLVDLVNQFRGDAADALHGRQMPCHYVYRKGNYMSISSVVGSRIPLAVGTAWAAKIRGDRIVTLAYLGDGGTSTADFHAGMNFAGVFHTPTVFVCNNNQWAISLPVSRQTASETLAEKALAYGFEGVRVDGMDALAVFAATRDAVKKARAGGGPTLIEALAYRLGPHSSSDDPSRYRDEKEVEAWRKRDPLVVYRSYLRHLGIWTEEFEAAMEKEIGEEISEAVQKAEAQPPPPVETMFTDVYAEMPPHLEEELQDLTSLRRR